MGMQTDVLWVDKPDATVDLQKLIAHKDYFCHRLMFCDSLWKKKQTNKKKQKKKKATKRQKTQSKEEEGTVVSAVDTVETICSTVETVDTFISPGVDEQFVQLVKFKKIAPMCSGKLFAYLSKDAIDAWNAMAVAASEKVQLYCYYEEGDTIRIILDPSAGKATWCINRDRKTWTNPDCDEEDDENQVQDQNKDTQETNKKKRKRDAGIPKLPEHHRLNVDLFYQAVQLNEVKWHPVQTNHHAEVLLASLQLDMHRLQAQQDAQQGCNMQ